MQIKIDWLIVSIGGSGLPPRSPGGGASGLYASAVDLHKTGLGGGGAGIRRPRFLRSRSHQNLLRIDVRAAAADSRDHLVTATPRQLFGAG